MNEFVSAITALFTNLANSVPLPLFVTIGSFLEEFIAPLPSALVTGLAGSFVAASDKHWGTLILLALLSSLGKTTAAYLHYLIGDKGEDFVLSKFGTFFGVTHEHIENIGNKLTKDWRDDALLFALRAFPLGPTAIVSLFAGIIRMNRRSFLVWTFLGYFIRSIVVLALGFSGINAIEWISSLF